MIRNYTRIVKEEKESQNLINFAANFKTSNIMPSISFVFRPSTRIGDFPGSLYVRMIHQRKVKTATVPGHLYRNEWDYQKQAIIFPENDPIRTAYLEELEQQIQEARHIAGELIGMVLKQGHCTLEDVIQQYRIQNYNGKLLSFAELLARGLEKNGQYRTANAYRTVARGFVRFNDGHDIPLTAINAGLVKAFETSLKKKGKMPNTISYYMRNLRSIYNRSVKEKRIHARRDNPFAEVFTGIKKTHKRALSIEDVSKLFKLDLHNRLKSLPGGSHERIRITNLYFAWRLFFFCFHARGMCFVDMAYLKKSSIQNGMMRYRRKKTGQLIEVKVTREMQRIMDSFSVVVNRSEYVFPIITTGEKDERTQYETAMRIQNRRLKELASMAGIDQTVTTHVARHSWATIGKQQNLPLWVISEGLGHASEKVTYSYLASFDQSVLDNANKLIAKAIKRGKRT